MIENYTFVPRNDMGISDNEIVKEHNDLIKEGKYAKAVALLNTNSYNKGFRASLFTSIESKLQDLGLYLLNTFVANEDEYYSLTEPTTEFMNENGYTFWIQPY